MPIHDWARVDAGIFHHFQLEWIGDLSRVLNRGLLPPDYYALAEQIAGEFGPDVLTLQRPTVAVPGTDEPPGGLALAAAPPRVRFRSRAEPDQYAAKARTVVIRHTSHHRIIAMVEIVSPGNKSSHHRLRSFADKAVQVLRAGIHLVIVDLFPPDRAILRASTRPFGTNSSRTISLYLRTSYSHLRPISAAHFRRRSSSQWRSVLPW